MPSTGRGGIVWPADRYAGHGSAGRCPLGRPGTVLQGGAAAWDGIHQQIVQDNAAFRDAADSTGFDSAHQAGAMLAEEAKTISEWHDGVAKKCNGIAVVLRETAAGQDQLVRDADAAINAAKLPGSAKL